MIGEDMAPRPGTGRNAASAPAVSFHTVPGRSPVSDFAVWFHQDFALMGVGFEAFGRAYVRQLSPADRAALGAGLRELLERHAGRSGHGLLNAWKRQGAASVPRAGGIRDLLTGFAQACEGRQGDGEEGAAVPVRSTRERAARG